VGLAATGVAWPGGEPHNQEEVLMAKEQVGNFDIPRDMRSFAEQSVEQARKAFDGFMSAAQKAAANLEGQATAAQEGAQDMRRKAMTFAEKNVSTSFDFAQRLMRAKDVEEVTRLQTEFLQSQMQAFAQQAQELGQSATRTAVSSARAGAS
jgi:phasin